MLQLPRVSREQLEVRPADWSGIPQADRARFLHPGEMEVIAALMRGAHRVVEFGCQNGRTARVLLDTLPEIDSYVGIDVPPGYVTEKAVQRKEIPEKPGEHALADPRFRLLIRDRGSYDVSPDEIGPVDAAFVDGDHSRAGVENDYALARKCVAPGGVIIFHDYHALGTVDVKDVLDELAAGGRAIFHVADTWIAYERF